MSGGGTQGGVTRGEIEQYAALKKEISSLERRIETLRSASATVSDTVTASAQAHPYSKQRVRVEGESARMQRLRSRLQNRRNRLQEEAAAIEAFLDTLESSEIRQIIQYKYIDGLTWTAVSCRVFGYPSESRVRKKLDRFFEKL